MSTDAMVVQHPKHPLINGRPIHLRLVQQIGWGFILGALFAAVVAGVYAAITQVDWNIGPWHLFWFKPGFDNGLWGNFKSASYALYRHGERDMGEPAFATFGLLTVMAKAKYWGRRVATWRLFVTPPLVIVMAMSLILGAVWLTYFGLPQAFPKAHAIWTNPHYPLVATLVFGLVIGKLCHLVWAPVGAHINGDLIDGSVYRYQHGKNLASTVLGTTMGEPAWVTYPLAPPVVREHWTVVAQHDVAKPGANKAWGYGVLFTAGAFFCLLGLTFHFVIGVAGLHVPYFSPPPLP